jgi:ABC-type transport system involved in cytochrome c biogenesis permease subunit
MIRSFRPSAIFESVVAACRVNSFLSFVSPTVLTILIASAPLRAADSAYAKVLGDIAVMEAGRVKPLDTVARHETKQIYGRETIKLTGPDGTVKSWGPVEAFIDWQMPTRDTFWDDQPFILAEFVPLKEKLLASAVKQALRAAIDDASTEASAKSALEALTKDEIVNHEALKRTLASVTLPATHKDALQAMSRKLDVAAKWLSPKDLETATVTVDGKTIPFEDWFRNLVRKKNGGGMGGEPVKLSELENRAYEVGGRLVHYKGIRDRTGVGSSPIYAALPRPGSEAYVKFVGEALKKAIEGQETALSPLQRDAVAALDRYFEDIPKSDRAMPGTNADFDRKFSEWLTGRSPWIPLFTVIESDDAELTVAGFPGDKSLALRDAFRALEAKAQEESGIDEAKASAFASAIRAVGESVGAGTYPTAETLARETHFNKFAPFFKAPAVYGTGLFLLLFSLVFTGIGANSKGFFATAGKLTYWTGMAAFVAGIALEIYGFYLRVMISGWAPVTNMYETVIWVALVTAVLGLAMELIYRKIYAATAACGVAMLATLLAANVTLLDPEIRSLQPVLRSNYWLTIHVLTIVSSYAAFALALGLGLLATVYYLTATYRTTPSLASLVLPGLIGLPVLAFGYMASTGAVGEFVKSETGFYLSFLAALTGLTLVVGSISAVVGELVARLLFRAYTSESPKASTVSEDWSSVTEREAESLLAEGTSTLTKSADGSAVAVLDPPSTQAKPKPSKLTDSIRQSSLQGVEPRSPRERSMTDTAARIKPLSNFIYRAMQVGVLLVAAGTILGGVWADYSWGRFWGWDPKEVWALIVLLVYLVPLHGRFAGWVNTFTLVAASVVCFMSVMMAWYGVNFVLGVGLHSYGFVEGGSQGVVLTCCTAVSAIVAGAWWRRYLAQTRPA